MKKYLVIPIILFIIIMMVLFLAARGGGNEENPSGNNDDPSQTQQEQNSDNGEIDVSKWLNYLTDTYDLAFTDGDHKYWGEYYPTSITENETDEAKSSLFKFEDMPMDMQNVLVGNMFTASATLSGNNNLDPASGEVIGNATDDLYFYGDSDPSPTKAWNYTYNNAQYSISIVLSSSKHVEMTVTAYKGDAAIGGETSTAQAGSYDGPFDEKWPDCVWTRLVPKPEFSDKSTKTGTYSAEGLDRGFAAGYADVTVDEAKEYVKAVQEAGFTESVTENGNDTLYYYKAFNEDHVKFELNLNPTVGTSLMIQ